MLQPVHQTHLQVRIGQLHLLQQISQKDHLLLHGHLHHNHPVRQKAQVMWHSLQLQAQKDLPVQVVVSGVVVEVEDDN